MVKEKSMSKPTIDAIKEFLRIVALAVVPALIVVLENGEVSAKAIILVLVVAILKAIDEFLHEKGKLEENASLTKGLTRF